MVYTISFESTGEIWTVLIAIGAEHREIFRIAGEKIVLDIFKQRRGQVVGDDIRPIRQPLTETDGGHCFDRHPPAIAVNIFRLFFPQQPVKRSTKTGEQLVISDNVDQPQYKNYNLRVKGKKTRSHSFWDSSPSFFHKGWTCEDFARELDTMSETEIAAICEGTPDDWAHENALAMREIFKLLPAACEYTDLPESDKERMREISDRQIVKAGYRLAAILNGIFDPKNSKR